MVVRRTRFDKEKAEARAHILEGLLIALDHIDSGFVSSVLVKRMRKHKLS